MTPPEQITLGTTNVRIAPLGIGTWAWGDRFTWGYQRGQEAELKAAFQALVAAGVNFFDTAEMYGPHTAERLLGQFIRETNAPVVVATKYFPLPWRFERGAIMRALRGSLKRLGLAQVDLYQIHWPLGLVSIEARAEALAEAVAAGLTRAVGVSNYNVAQMRRTYDVLAKRGVKLASNQVNYSLLERSPERNGVLAACRELGVTLIAYSPLAMGMLSGKYTAQNPPPGSRRRRYPPERLARMEPLIQLLKTSGQAHGKTPSQVALNWLIGKRSVPIPGVRDVRQAQDNLGALGWRLSDAEMGKLDEASGSVASSQ